jgi:hypothetical protein
MPNLQQQGGGKTMAELRAAKTAKTMKNNGQVAPAQAAPAPAQAPALGPADCKGGTKPGEKYKDACARARECLKTLAKPKMTIGQADGLANYSAKYSAMLEKIAAAPGSSLVYSQFLDMEGVGIFRVAMDVNGYAPIEIVNVDGALAFTKATGREAPNCGSGARTHDLTAPVTCVTAADARAYVEWLTRISGIAYRLPAETEWEWAARGGHENRYVTGAVAPITLPVTNAIGMAGLHGGAAEIVGACWTATHADMSRAATRSSVDTRCWANVVRDAASGEPPVLSRLSARRQLPAGQRSPFVGFRIARDL